ncbi:alpha/beta fold hydrolase [Kiloniella sp. EL199]|uniref:alpha/beta fold hydrolase n=1 Tax=Kiloniella sp. EL199 TaxID=2107581 RepID=UPI000EA1AEEB|nr:alpha/beta hydrolase [Kiloniella sp. EL199]
MRVVFVHGWGYGPDIWQSVIRLLGPDISCDLVDLGFSGTERIPAGHYDIAVGHSMGCQWLLSQTDIIWEKSVLINGFSRFSACDDFPEGMHPRVIDRMLRKLPKAPVDVLRSFHQLCDPGGRTDYHAIETPDLSKLIWGLNFLREQDQRLNFTEESSYILADKDDQVVTEAMTVKLFKSNSQWTEGKGHLLPLTDPVACHSVIKRAITDL